MAEFVRALKLHLTDCSICGYLLWLIACSYACPKIVGKFCDPSISKATNACGLD